jgi:hypothetical protein
MGTHDTAPEEVRRVISASFAHIRAKPKSCEGAVRDSHSQGNTLRQERLHEVNCKRDDIAKSFCGYERRI